jgi:ribose 5-phosphate isomerase A
VSTDEQKRRAAEHAATFVEEGMVVGLGSGTTAEKAVDALGRRFQDGVRFVGVPTSKQTAHLAQSFGIPLIRLDEITHLDLVIDGSDEVDPHLDLIKGHGGALVREKLVASSGRRFVVIVDESKLVSYLGERSPIPIEVVPFGWTTTRHRLEGLGLHCELRGAEQPYTTSNHNYILDCRLADGARSSMAVLADEVKRQTGVVDHGLFLGMASAVVVGRASGQVDVLARI